MSPSLHLWMAYMACLDKLKMVYLACLNRVAKFCRDQAVKVCCQSYYPVGYTPYRHSREQSQWRAARIAEKVANRVVFAGDTLKFAYGELCHWRQKRAAAAAMSIGAGRWTKAQRDAVNAEVLRVANRV